MGETYTLTAAHMYSLRIRRIITLPKISTEEIHDKSKANPFVKAVAVCQVFWIPFQVIVRAAKGLVVSQLELAVTAFSVCAVVTYLLLFEKPQGVNVPTQPITCSHGTPFVAERDFDAIQLRIFFIPGLYMNVYQRDRIHNDEIYCSEKELCVFLGGVILGGMIFGSI